MKFTRFITQHTLESLIPQWMTDHEVTYYLYRGKLPETITGLNPSTDIQFDIFEHEQMITIGYAGIHSINWLSRSAEVRIFIGNKNYWNRSYGKKALNEIIAYAFKSLNLNRLWLGVNAEHKNAITLYTQAGFKQEGVLREEFYKHGRYTDITRMGLLRREWENKKNNIDDHSQFQNG